MSTEGARLYIQPNLSGKRTEETFHRQGVFVLCFLFGAAGDQLFRFLFMIKEILKRKAFRRNGMQKRGNYASIRKFSLPYRGKNE